MTSHDPVREGEVPSAADERMADLLARERRPPMDERRRLRDEGTPEAEDLLSRLDALDFVDSLVGEVPSDVPEQLGEFRIVGLLGRGGMGTVYEAWQESLERVVALKVLPPQLSADAKMRQRFRTEARAAATLHHQHIVPIYGYGKSGGLLFFAMERVDGVSLDKHIQHARRLNVAALEPREAARRFAGVADALAHAHRRGILHRDVKPGNVLVHPDGSLALADFGLSKFLDEHSQSLSREGGFLGTLHYAAPEQAKGHRASAASDLYALGVTMYECVAGRLPLTGSSTEALLEAVLHGRPSPLRRAAPKAPRDLEAVLDKLLAKEPGDRYSDGEALARDLIRVADDEPVRIRRLSFAVLAWRQVRKHKFLSSVIAVAAALLLTSLVLWRQAVDQEQQGRVTRYETLLAAAVERAETEPGPAGGPSAVMRALTGLPGPLAESEPRVVRMLGDAESLVSEQSRTAALRDAYQRDPLPEATASVVLGNGWAARRLLDSSIAESEQKSGFAQRDAVTWLRLYRLYMARAVACLTASVADDETAGKDLLRASIVRPGAFAPDLLMLFIEWSPAEGAEILLARVDAMLVDAPAGASEVAGGLMRAFAGLVRPESSHLMAFAMPYATRRVLHERARELLGTMVDRGGPFTVRAGALEDELFDAARRAAAAVDDASVLGAALTDGRRRLGEAVAPKSPLQSWRMVYALLEDPGSSIPDLPGGDPMPVRTQLRAWDALLDLDLPTVALRSMTEAFDRTIIAAADVAMATRARLEARFAARLGEPEDALAKAQTWVESATDDPNAYLCRFIARVRAGDTGWASFDASRALQLAVDATAVRRALSSVLSRAQDEDPERSAEWQRLEALFRERGE